LSRGPPGRSGATLAACAAHIVGTACSRPPPKASARPPAEEAIVRAASVRFRPIMMTTFAALMAAIPGGLAFSQLVTLYVTPVLYTYLDELQSRLRRRRGRAAALVLASSDGEGRLPNAW
jgi:hypothetical protein